jgi:hypothetical protein
VNVALNARWDPGGGSVGEFVTRPPTVVVVTAATFGWCPCGTRAGPGAEITPQTDEGTDAERDDRDRERPMKSPDL